MLKGPSTPRSRGSLHETKVLSTWFRATRLEAASSLQNFSLSCGASAAHTELQQTHLQIVVRNTRHVKHWNVSTRQAAQSKGMSVDALDMARSTLGRGSRVGLQACSSDRCPSKRSRSRDHVHCTRMLDRGIRWCIPCAKWIVHAPLGYAGMLDCQSSLLCEDFSAVEKARCFARDKYANTTGSPVE